MSSRKASNVSDLQSEILLDDSPPRRGRPPTSRKMVLAAAADLFTHAEAHAAVSMDDIAAAAGVGKGTLFRAFGSRAGLIEAIFEARIVSFREAVEHGPVPLGPQAPAAQRLVAILDALLTLKLQNANLIRARESSGAELVSHGFYSWIHELLSSLISQAAVTDGEFAAYAAHALLSMQRPDIAEHLQSVNGLSRDDLRQAQAVFVRRVIGHDATSAKPPS